MGREEHAPGARLRSRLNWLILKTLAVDIAVPLHIAEVFEALRALLTSRSITQYEYNLKRPSLVAIYLHRLADRGYVNLQGLKRTRQAMLTPAGRKALRVLEDALRARGDRDVLNRAAGLSGLLHRLRRNGFRRLCPAVIRRRMDRRRQIALRRIRGSPRATAFVSYDLPSAESGHRRTIVAVLQGHGFTRLHQSMYTGPSDHLRAAVEMLEGRVPLDRLRWGTLTVYSS
jgi:hypothetical protein